MSAGAEAEAEAGAEAAEPEPEVGGTAASATLRVKVPSVNSDDPQERIAARRLRIAARQEAKRR